MTSREIIESYRDLNAADRSAFRKWLVVNAAVGAFSVLVLIAVTSMNKGDSSEAIASQNQTHHAEAR
jgi:hypothetical protein